MTMPLINFPLLNAEQAGNPFGSLMSGYSQGIINRNKLLENALKQIKLKYAEPEERAALELAQAKPGLTKAQTNYQNQLAQWVGPQAQAYSAAQYGQADQSRAAAQNQLASAALTRGQTPYMIQQEQEKLFSDPIIQRQYQLGLAKNIPGLSQSLSNLGLSGQQGNGQIQNQNFNNPIQIPYSQNQNFNNPTQIPYAQNNNLDPSTAPKMFNGNSAQNFALFGSPYNPIELKQMEASAKAAGTQGVTNFNDALKEASSDTQNAIQMKNLASEFKEAYDNSYYKGPRLGNVPSSGMSTFLTKGSLKNEGLADIAGNSLAALNIKILNGAKVAGPEIGFLKSIKPNRNLAPETVETLINFTNAKADRLQERQKFLNTAQKRGIDINTANTLFNQYDSNHPVYSFKNNKVNSDNMNKWELYLTPQAIRAAQQGTSYVPIEKMNRSQIDQLSPQARIMAIKMLQER